MIKIIIFILSIAILYPIPDNSLPLSTEDHKNLVKIKSNQYILYESYLDNTENRGIASVFGYHYDTFLNKNVKFFYGNFFLKY